MPDVSSIGPKRPCRRPPATLHGVVFDIFGWEPQRRGMAASILEVERDHPTDLVLVAAKLEVFHVECGEVVGHPSPVEGSRIEWVYPLQWRRGVEPHDQDSR